MYVTERVKKRGKKKREVIRFKNSFFSVFLHGCHVPVVEVLCVSRLLFIARDFTAKGGGALRVFKLLLILDLSHFAMAVYVTLEVLLR
jgi:hypothetical protein